ncbi:MAG: Fic family protein [Bacilli bacterium]|nr:Fic family protein [Bacilli bacterium]
MTTILKEQAIKYDYFDISKYLDNVVISSDNLNRAFYTLKEYNEYVSKFKKYDQDAFGLLLVKAFYNELRDSNRIEDHIIYPEEVLNGDYNIDDFNISHTRIKQLHSFSERGTGEYDYRKIDAWVRLLQNDKETIFWYGAKPCDIEKFMDDYINLYKSDLYDDNMFLKCILLHLTLMRIHPFKDGNGRTIRLLTDMKFTELTNRLFNTNLAIAPLHLSNSLYRNKARYNSIIDSIYFDMDHDSNKEINNFIKFMLDMYDEQIFYMNSLLDRSKISLLNSIANDNLGNAKVLKK